MSEKRRIGVYGGTFDPIHVGHLYIAANARSALELDEVIFIPSAVPPHKRGRRITDSAHRLRMCELAVAGHQGFSVSDMEIRRPGVSYSVLTLAELAELHPDADLYFIVGGDMFADLESWYRSESLLSDYRIIALSRPGFDLNAILRDSSFLSRFRERIHAVEILPLQISATELRQAIASGQNVSYLVPIKVAEYIRDRKLYTGGEYDE